MKSDVGYFRLGLFVVSGLLLLVVGVAVLGAGAMFKKMVHIQTVTIESVEGLDVGAAVKFRGVTVGKVSAISVALDQTSSQNVAKRIKMGNEIIIDMELETKHFPSTNEQTMRANFAKAADAGLRASISSSGLTGPPYIELVFLDPVSNPPPVVSVVSTGPYIPSAPGAFSKITEDVSTIATQLRKADVGKVIDHVNNLIVSVDKTVNDLQMVELRKQVGLITANLDASTKQLNKILNDPKIDGIVKNASDMVASAKNLVGGDDVKKAAADLPKITGRLNNAVDRVDALVHGPDLQEILDNLRNTTGSAAVAGEEARRALRTLDQMLLAEQQNIADAIADLHRVLENVEALTSELKTNPSRVIFGKPPPRIQPGADK